MSKNDSYAKKEENHISPQGVYAEPDWQLISFVLILLSIRVRQTFYTKWSKTLGWRESQFIFANISISLMPLSICKLI